MKRVTSKKHGKQPAILIGAAQLDNNLSWQENCMKAKKIIRKLAREKVQLVCFQEAFLSGYHASFFKRDSSILSSLLEEIKIQAYKSDVCVFLPTMQKIGKYYYNAVYTYNSDKGDSVCYKQGLISGEKTVLKSKKGKRSFKVNGIEFGALICRELEDPAFTYFKKDKLPDILLWPSYWGWQYHHKWGPIKNTTGKPDPCYKLIKKLKRPIIQINMSTTIQIDMSVKKFGKSVLVNKDGTKVGVGKYGKEDLLIISYRNGVVKKIKNDLEP